MAYKDTMQDFALTPQEMLRKKTFLRVNEAAYCLNVSPRTIYFWIEMGILKRLRLKPIRISSEDVLTLMNDFDE